MFGRRSAWKSLRGKRESHPWRAQKPTGTNPMFWPGSQASNSERRKLLASTNENALWTALWNCPKSSWPAWPSPSWFGPPRPRSCSSGTAQLSHIGPCWKLNSLILTRLCSPFYSLFICSSFLSIVFAFLLISYLFTWPPACLEHEPRERGVQNASSFIWLLIEFL